MLVIELLEFHNPMNWEIQQFQSYMLYCCCDVDDTCNFDRSHPSLTTCPNYCDVFFTVALHGSGAQENPSISTISETLFDTSRDSFYGYIFTFNLDSVPSDVSGVALLHFKHVHEVIIIVIIIVITITSPEEVMFCFSLPVSLFVCF